MHVLMTDLDRAVAELPPEQLPHLIGLLGILAAKAQLRLLAGSAKPSRQEDQLLAVAEASKKLGMTKDYLYRHAETFPFSVRVTARQLRFSLKGIDEYIARQHTVSPS